eukprot:CAMPEP_0194491010 /NCGR_PEP_ID=MMETSP0253-20130528/10040_1 /TAXON_ID=2966 /ORGANISM="Noctiluca scintillans" /LENGTH=127 /DNA_ID=CAMNT_0039331697 /DNA_START=58 /DNA_END=439 /DNA_ORIENTATION=-
MARPIYDGIVKKISEALSPESLVVVDDSSAHRGHAGVRDATTPETHFSAVIIGDRFDGMSRVERQRFVMGLLDEEFRSGLHALELRAARQQRKQESRRDSLLKRRGEDSDLLSDVRITSSTCRRQTE